MRRFAIVLGVAFLCSTLLAGQSYGGKKAGKGKNPRARDATKVDRKANAAHARRRDAREKRGPRGGYVYERIVRSLDPRTLSQISPKVRKAFEDFEAASAIYQEALRDVIRSVHREARAEGLRREDLTPEKIEELFRPHKEELQDIAKDVLEAYIAFQEVAIAEIEANMDKAAELLTRRIIAELSGARRAGKAVGGRGRAGKGKADKASAVPTPPVQE